MQYIDAVLKNIVKKSPEIFHINGYDTYDALLKELYWSNFRVGSLYYALDQLKEDYTIEYCQPYFQGNYFKELLKWLRNSFQLLKASYKTKSILTSNVKSKYIIGFIINNDFIFNLYENLIYKFKSDDVVLFLQNNLNQINTNKIDKSGIKYFYTKELNNTKTTFKFINPLLYNAVELEVINVFLQYKFKLTNAIDTFLTIKNFNLKKIIVNEAENIPELLLLKSVLGDSTLLYNTMNGAKSGEAHDSILNIDGWFVWDIYMKDFMYENGVPFSTKLLPLGHLSYDNAIKHKFSNSFNFNINSDAIIISVFSVNDDRPEKISLLNLIQKILNQYPNRFLFLYRKHPAEKSNLKLPNSKDFIEIIYNQSNSKSTLYDQLSVSDLSIVYGSTVALESTWFKVPCVTFEPYPTTILNFINSIYFKHINSINVLEDFILNSTKKNNDSLNYKDSQLISSIYFEYLVKD